MLAEAVCKLEGFNYAPSDTVYWQQGHSTERDFIYVTTQHLTPSSSSNSSDEVGPSAALLVLCTAFRGKADRCPNLTVKKIPKAGALPLRVGPRRLQPAGGEPAQGAASGRSRGPPVSAKEAGA